MKNKIRNLWVNFSVFLKAIRQGYFKRTDKKCPKCETKLYVEKYLDEYPYICIKCDENFYSVEAVD